MEYIKIPQFNECDLFTTKDDSIKIEASLTRHQLKDLATIGIEPKQTIYNSIQNESFLASIKELLENAIVSDEFQWTKDLNGLKILTMFGIDNNRKNVIASSGFGCWISEFLDKNPQSTIRLTNDFKKSTKLEFQPLYKFGVLEWGDRKINIYINAYMKFNDNELYFTDKINVSEVVDCWLMMIQKTIA
ncbi:hypothetical protein [Tenacibaculum phage PTm5]|uniref:Uncharacterized protein n=1 Tax=Tenacibaculum phage PTm5 TaxID=2547426 RepID=A0A5S9HXJ5_9CAUD|nr:hypothetical protein [Tenacibaculum phage PTm5]